jgi:hypothetical protein
LDGSDGDDRIRVKLQGWTKNNLCSSAEACWIDEDAGLVTDEECVCDRVKRAGGHALSALKPPPWTSIRAKASLGATSRLNQRW